MISMCDAHFAATRPAYSSLTANTGPALWRTRAAQILLALSVWCAILWPATAHAQDVNYTQNTVDTNRRSDMRVDPTTLGLGFQLTLRDYPGRAGSSLPINLSYSSKLWRIDFQDIDGGPSQRSRAVPKYAEHSESGWTTNLDPPELEWLDWQPYDAIGQGICLSASCPQEPYQTILYVNRILAHMPDGSTHELRRDDTPTSTHTSGGIYYAVDGSGLRYDASANVLYLPDGSRYLFSGGIRFIDRNGNTLVYNQTAKTWTDTLGRVISRPRLDSSQAGDFPYTVKGVGGTDVTYTLRWRNLSEVRTYPNPPLHYTGDKTLVTPMQSLSPSLFTSTAGGMEYICSALSQTFNPVVLYQVELPGGAGSYTFTYNVSGEIDKVVYPTGGYERYRYEAIDGISQALNDGSNYAQANRGVVERWVSTSGNEADEVHWLYSASNNNLTTPYTVTTTAPDGTRIERVLYSQSSGDVRFGFESVLLGKTIEERIYSPTEQMLRRTLTDWTNSGPLTGGDWSATRDPKVTKQVNILLDTADGYARSATTIYRYDQASQPLNVTSVTQYGYDSTMTVSAAQTAPVTSFNPASTLALRTTETAYLEDADYEARNLVSLPVSVKIRKGGLTGVIVAQTETNYDEAAYPLLTCGATVGWTNPGTLPRAIATTTRRWLNTTGAWIETHAQYDQCGNIRKTWDANNNLSQVEYSSTHKYAYPTKTTSPIPDTTGLRTPSASLVTTTTYDLSTGLVMSSTDANGIRTDYEYNDVLNRQTRVVRAVGTSLSSQTSVSYDDAGRVVTTTSDLAALDDNLLKSETVYDGLGRTTETRGYETATTYVTTKQIYDAMGRISKVSNPYRTGQTVVWMTTTYDALGRVTSIKTPDNAVVSTSYTGEEVTVTDQAGRDRQSTTDALGNLVKVVEDPGGLNYQTTYEYDTLGNLTKVLQGTQTRTFTYDSLSRLKTAANPESGTASYQYDNNGNLTQKTDALTTTTTFTYDALNRVMVKNYGDATPDVNYYYDSQSLPTGAPSFVRGSSIGRLVAVLTGGTSAGSYYGYDALGQTLRRIQRTDSINYLTDATYNKAGAMVTQTYPAVPGASDRRVVNYSFDGAGRLSSLTSAATTYAAGANVGSISYAAHGGLSSETYGNNLVHALTYNNRLQPTQIKLGTTASPTSVLNLTYNYGTTTNNGNVLDATNKIGTWTTKQIYTYDSLNRLDNTSETNGSTLTYWTEDEAYDRYGNRWEVVGGIPSLTFNSQNRIVGHTYDAPGNVTNDTAHTYVYDAENRIKTVNGVANTYIYDGEGKRVKKYFPLGEQVRFVYGISGELIAEFDTTTGALEREYVYGAGGLLATIEPVNGTKYATADHLGSPRVVTGSTGAVVSRHDYKPFGRELMVGEGGRTAAQGFGVNDSVREKFTGYERDNETGLDYAQARYYSSVQGRFTSTDPLIASARAGNPQSWNRYSYVLNRPLNLIDPSGLSARSSDGGCAAEFSTCSDEGGGGGALSNYEAGIQHQRNAVAATNAAREGDWDTYNDLMASDPTLVNPQNPGTILVIVGDPGLAKNVGPGFDRVAETKKRGLEAQGYKVIVVRASGVADFAQALTNNGILDGVEYVGHAAWNALYVGEQHEPDTNVDFSNLSQLSNANLSQNAYIKLNGCNTADGGAVSIGARIAYQLQRTTFAFDGPTIFSGDERGITRFTRTSPVYMIEDRGTRFIRFRPLK